MKGFIPTLPEFGREALILIGGALIAAAIMRAWPQGRDYIRSAWGEPGAHT